MRGHRTLERIIVFLMATIAIILSAVALAKVNNKREGMTNSWDGAIMKVSESAGTDPSLSSTPYDQSLQDWLEYKGITFDAASGEVNFAKGISVTGKASVDSLATTGGLDVAGETNLSGTVNVGPNGSWLQFGVNGTSGNEKFNGKTPLFDDSSVYLVNEWRAKYEGAGKPMEGYLYSEYATTESLDWVPGDTQKLSGIVMCNSGLATGEAFNACSTTTEGEITRDGTNFAQWKIKSADLHKCGEPVAS